MFDYLIILSLLLNTLAFGLILHILGRLRKYENTPLKLDEESYEKVEKLMTVADKTRRDLGHQVGVARVAIREASQAATNARTAARGDRKW